MWTYMPVCKVLICLHGHRVSQIFTHVCPLTIKNPLEEMKIKSKVNACGHHQNTKALILQVLDWTGCEFYLFTTMEKKKQAVAVTDEKQLLFLIALYMCVLLSCVSFTWQKCKKKLHAWYPVSHYVIEVRACCKSSFKQTEIRWSMGRKYILMAIFSSDCKTILVLHTLMHNYYIIHQSSISRGFAGLFYILRC